MWNHISIDNSNNKNNSNTPASQYTCLLFDSDSTAMYLAIGDGVKHLVDLVGMVDVHFDWMRIDAGVRHHNGFNVINDHLVHLSIVQNNVNG